MRLIPLLRQIRSVKNETALFIRHSSSDRLTVPSPEGSGIENPKISNIVSQISSLTLLEVSELSSLLKTRLNIPDQVAQVAYSAPSSVSADDEEAAPKKVQTAFKVKLIKFDEKQKIALIKEIKNLLEGMNLVQAKKFVESAPTIVKQDIPKEEAEKLKEALCKVGAEIEID